MPRAALVALAFVVSLALAAAMAWLVRDPPATEPEVAPVPAARVAGEEEGRAASPREETSEKAPAQPPEGVDGIERAPPPTAPRRAEDAWIDPEPVPRSTDQEFRMSAVPDSP